MDFYKRALELKDETVADRRYIHQNAETGLELPKTKAYVMDKLKEYGLDPVECGDGVTATLGTFSYTHLDVYKRQWKNYWGVKKIGDMYSIVTSGVGVYGPNIRVGTDSEIMVVTVHFE